MRYTMSGPFMSSPSRRSAAVCARHQPSPSRTKPLVSRAPRESIHLKSEFKRSKVNGTRQGDVVLELFMLLTIGTVLQAMSFQQLATSAEYQAGLMVFLSILAQA